MSSRFLSFIHPLLVSIAPILLLAAVNVAQVEPSDLKLPLATAVILPIITGAVWWILIRDFEHAALLTSLSILIFMLHGHVHLAVSQVESAPGSRMLHLILFAVWMAAVATVYFLLLTRKPDTTQVTKLVTTISAIVLVMGAFQLSRGMAKSRSVAVSFEQRESVFPTSAIDISLRQPSSTSSELPDIYYIVLDGYLRRDQLTSVCDYENSEFYQFLDAKQFYIADRSHSNYASTFLSVASSMNLRYLDSEVERFGPSAMERGPIYDMIRTNDVARYLMVKGYQFVHLNTWWGATARSDIADDSSPLPSPEFHNVLLKTTMLEPVASRISIARELQHLLGRERQLLLSHFETLEGIPDREEPTFTFAHIIYPHPPFVFDQDGVRAEKVKGWKGHEREYVDQIIYLNRRIQTIVENILDQPGPKPIILLQADHGSAFLLDEESDFAPQRQAIKERMSILNAFYVPESCRKQLYDTITPVNTFRVLLNSLFDEPLQRLPDRVLFSGYSNPYQLIDVTEELIPRDDVSRSVDPHPLDGAGPLSEEHSRAGG